MKRNSKAMTKLSKYKEKIPKSVYEIISHQVGELRPAQMKAINSGLFNDKNLLVCTPTASGKTLVAEMGFLYTILEKKKKAVYVVPLRALASEKYKEFREKYEKYGLRIAISTGDFDSDDAYLKAYDLIITTSEKLDSLLRHKAPWLNSVGLLIIDEIHLLNDASRGPTLEMVITLIRMLIDPQIIALSATIGNPEELAEWLNAILIYDEWRPVKLYKGIMINHELEFYE